MVNVADYKKGNWLKADDLKTGDLITFKNSGDFVPDNFNEGKEVLEILVELPDGCELLAKPNKTSVNALSDLENGGWGDDVANWVGKQAIVEIKDEVVNGTDRKAIYLIPNEDVVPVPPADKSPIEDKDIPVAGEPAEEVKKK